MGAEVGLKDFYAAWSNHLQNLVIDFMELFGSYSFLENAHLIRHEEYDIELAESWMIGDRPSDVMTGVNAGTKSILVLTGVPTVESPEATKTCTTLLEAAEFIASQEASSH